MSTAPRPFLRRMPDLARVIALAPFAFLACAAIPPPAPATVAAPDPRSVAAAIPTPTAPTLAPVPDAQTALAMKIDPIFSDFTPKGAMSPGCAVGVYRAGEIVFSKGYGYADVEHDAPITDTTPFYTASLSKQFTAAAVLLLAADGKVSLDDDVRKYVPELPDFGPRITLDHLLHHTSGLRDYHLLLQLDGLNEENVITRREVLWLLGHQRSLNFPPGAHISYSSSGYVLLAEIVARVSGESFHAFLAQRVLEPLGMKDSFVREDHARPVPHRAIGYTLGPDKQLRILMAHIEYDGSSNFVTTTRDLAKWDANFYDPKVGGQALIDGMRVQGKLTDGGLLDYAMGLYEMDTHGLHLEEHNGSFMGYRSTLLRYPTERLTVSLLCNTTEADPDALGEKVSAVFLPQLVAPERPSLPSPSATPPAFGFDLKTLDGSYVDQATAEVRALDTTGGVVHLRFGKGLGATRELVPVGPGDLLVKGRQGVHYTYEPAKGAHAPQIVRLVQSGEAPLTLVRTELVDKVVNLAEYRGRFGSDELANDLETRVEDGHLVEGPIGGAAIRLPITPVARDLFVSDDVGWKFERDARHKIIRLVVSTDRARGVVLVRR
jgi:CubicO group peptidase (beta-lactamase class C family)